MLDIKNLRDNYKGIKLSLKKRGYDLDEASFKSLDDSRKELQIAVENLQAERKKLSSEFGKLKASGEETSDLKKVIDKKNFDLEKKDSELQEVLKNLNNILLDMPNIPHHSVPEGSSEEDNKIVSKHGEIISTNTLDHLEITKKIDTELAAKLSGSRFAVLEGDLAKLQRSLITFMLDCAIQNGYKEYYVPFMANEESLTGTGQLPKFEEDLFKTSDKLYLIPTAEVPLTNLFRNEFLNEKDLPIKVTSHTPCFRSEAGSYGKDTRGLIRQHQFEKIELVQITHPNDSMDCLENLLNNACEILNKLDLPYQIVELCTGDLGFSSAKTFDIEVWMPSQKKYREISSCSNFTDFQARRSNIKFKSKEGNSFAHTINGSGLAVGRCLIALIENNFDGKDTINIPNCLEQYFGSNKIKQHQFEKIELVQITHPNDSMDCLENLLNNACEILNKLDLPYQIVELCTGDLGFSSAKTFDIEVWMPSQKKYREISSCSNFTDFQARRSNIKFKSKEGNSFAHTINGSGLAVGRCLIALIENNFDGKDTINIPNCLEQYFGSNKIKIS